MIKIATFSLSIYYGPTAHRTIISSTGLTIVHLLSNLIFTATHESGTVINLILQRGSWSSETIWKLSGVSQLAAELNFKPRVAAPVFYQSSIKLPPLTVHRLSASSIQNPTPIYKLTESSCCSHKLVNQIYWKQLQSSNNSMKILKSRTMKPKPDVIYPQGWQFKLQLEGKDEICRAELSLLWNILHPPRQKWDPNLVQALLAEFVFSCDNSLKT